MVSPLEVERGEDEDDTKLPDEDADEDDEGQSKRRRWGRRSKGSWFSGMLDSTKTPLSKLISKSIRHTLYPNRQSRTSLAKSDSARKSTKEEDDDELVEIELQ